MLVIRGQSPEKTGVPVCASENGSQPKNVSDLFWPIADPLTQPRPPVMFSSRNHVSRQIKAAPFRTFASLLSVLLALCAFASQALAATYYIDNVSGSDSNPGTSKNSAWKLCPGMVGFSGSYTYSAGDVFVFKGGVTWTYVSGGSLLNVLNSNTAYTSDKSWYSGTAWDYPVLDGNAPAASIHGINLSNKSDVVIEYIKLVRIGHRVEGSGNAIACSGGSRITIRHNFLSPNSVNAIHYGSTGPASDILIHDNIIRQCGRLYVNGADHRLSNIQIYNNVMEGGWDYGPSPGYHTDGLMIEGSGVADYAIKDLQIYNNYFWGDWQKGATAQIYLTGTNAGNLKSTQNTRIYNNLLTCSNTAGSGGGALCGIRANFGHDNLQMVNNVIDFRTIAVPPSFGIVYYGTISNVENRNNIILGADNAIGYGTVGGNHVIDHCILVTPTGKKLIYATSAGQRWDTVASSQTGGGWLTGFGSTENPRFVQDVVGANHDSPAYGPLNGDWRIRDEESPAVGNGAALSSLFTFDMGKISRPLTNGSGTGWTIGAYEYIASSPDSPPVEPSSSTPPAAPSRARLASQN